MFFLDVQPRAPRYSNTTIIQADLHDGMTSSILAGGVVTQSAYCLHLLGSFEVLSIIDDEEQVSVFFGKQAQEHVQGDLLHYDRLIPDAAPEELPMIGSVGRASQCFAELVNGSAVVDSDGQYQSPEVLPRSLREMLVNWSEKTLQFFGNSADSNHMASPMISICSYKSYRQDRPILFDAFRNHKSTNRSV